MSTILLVSDHDRTIDSVTAALSSPGTSVVVERDPEAAVAAAADGNVDHVLIDMHVDAMGAVAVTHALRDATGHDSAPGITILLDRQADAFLAKRSGADGWVTKPVETSTLRAAVAAHGSDRGDA